MGKVYFPKIRQRRDWSEDRFDNANIVSHAPGECITSYRTTSNECMGRNVTLDHQRLIYPQANRACSLIIQHPYINLDPTKQAH